MKKVVLGNIGIGKFSSKDKKIYSAWSHMFYRCYSEENKILKPTYNDCIVCNEWHNFQIFAEWFEQNYIDGFVLDKDILVKGNKIYGPDTCCFVPMEINNLLIVRKSKLGYPIGVSPSNNGFRVKINKFGKQTHIGVYSNLEDAKLGYKLAKEQYLKESAEKWKDEISKKIYDCLINYEINI